VTRLVPATNPGKTKGAMILLRNSLSIRLLVPVLALVLVVAVTTTVVLAMLEANRVRSEAAASIDRQSRALQSLFAVTLSIMGERVQSSMRLLRQQGRNLGAAGVGPQISVAARPVNDLLLGNKPQGNHFDLVDGVTSTMDGTATLFSRSGDDFIRISTNVRKDDGTRAVGTQLDPKGRVIGEVRAGRGFYGVVDILGNPYVTGYEPILDPSQRNVIGVWYVGYKTDLQPLDAVVSNSRVLNSGFFALFDEKGKLRFFSKSGIGSDQITKVSREPPKNWVVARQAVPGWGFSLVSAYPASDVDDIITRQSIWIAGVGLFAGLLLLGLQSALIWLRVLRPIRRLTLVADELSLGRSHHEITEVKLNDEIGALAKAIARLSTSVRLAMDRLSKR
jgi:methyl-accepting chemotaxis protein